MTSLQTHSSSPSNPLLNFAPFFSDLATINPLFKQLKEARVIQPYLEKVQEAAAFLYSRITKISNYALGTNQCILNRSISLDSSEAMCYSLEQLESEISLLMKETFDTLKKSTAKETQGEYGNKFYNLKLQSNLNNPLSSIAIHVPKPIGVKSSIIQDFLSQEAPLIFELLEKLSHNYSVDNLDFLGLPQTQHLLIQIQDEITNSFDRLALDPRLFEKYFPQELFDWLKNANPQTDTLAIRSSGAEDSKTVVNAGGNTSKSYVRPNSKEIAKAAGEVVASYFSLSSLRNRIRAGSNPFKEKLQTSLIIQPLIGEAIGKDTNPADIPVSMVVFSNEPMFSGNEKFRVMRINAAYGHGEGVVGEHGIATDTYTVLISESNPENLYIIQDIQTKPYRLAPVKSEEGITLKQIENPQSLINRPTLSHDQIARIYLWSKMSEELFESSATDLEIVVKNDIIYPVQARPVKREVLLPTYVDVKELANLPLSPIEDYILCETIVAAKTSALVFQSKEEIIFAPTLKKAEELFETGKHKLVIISTEEPANSHPVVNFASLGIPCLYTSNNLQVQNLLLQLSNSKEIVVCMQTGAVYLWNSDKGQSANFIKSGFAVHPAQIAHTYPLKHNIRVAATSKVPESIKANLQALKEATQEKTALKYLNQLRQESSINDLSLDIEHLTTLTKASTNPSQKAVEILDLLKNIKSHIDLAFTELEAILNKKSANKRLQTLLQIKILENALTGNLKKNSMSGFSLAHTKELYDKAKLLLEYQNKLPYPAQCIDFLFLADAVHQPTTIEKWRSFLVELESDLQRGKVNQKEFNHFKESLTLFEEMNLISSWFTMFFEHSLNAYEGIAAQLLPSIFSSSSLRKILISLPSHEELLLIRGFNGFIQKLKDERARVELQEGIDSARKSYEMLNSLHQSLTQKQYDITSILKSASPMTKDALLETLGELNDLFDFTIKHMKSDVSIGDKDKTMLFKDIVKLYFNFLEKFIDKNSSLLTLLSRRTRILEKTEQFINTYQEALKLIKDEFETMSPSDTTNLRASKAFSVDGAKIGSDANIDRHLPKTIEDVFTFVHQSLITCFSNLRSQIYTPSIMHSSAIPTNFKLYALSLASKPGEFNNKIAEVENQRFDKQTILYPKLLDLNQILGIDKQSSILPARILKTTVESSDFDILKSNLISLYPRNYNYDDYKTNPIVQLQRVQWDCLNKPLFKFSSKLVIPYYHLTVGSKSNLKLPEIQTTGIQINDHEIEIKYNVPLNWHSGQMALRYNKLTNQTFATMQLLGLNCAGAYCSTHNNDTNRWELIAKNAQFLSRLLNISIAAPIYLTESELKIQFEIKNMQQYEKLIEIILLLFISSNYDKAVLPSVADFYLATTNYEAFFDSQLENNLTIFEALCLSPKANSANFQPAIEKAIKEVESNNASEQLIGVNKLALLFTHKLINKEMMVSAVYKTLVSSDDSLRSMSINLLTHLAHEKEFHEKGLEVALNNIFNESNEYATPSAFKLLRTLWVQGYGFDKSIKLIIEQIKTKTDATSIYENIILLSQLFKLKQGFVEATQLAESFIQSDDHAKQYIACQIFELLAEYEQSKEAITAAIKLQKTRHKDSYYGTPPELKKFF